MSLKQDIISIGKNVLTSSVKRRILVIESDDWGSIRTRDRDSYELLVKRSIIKENLLDKTDSIVTAHDLAVLIDELNSIETKNGQKPVLTCFFNTGNPDFKKIQNSGFETYSNLSYFDHLKSIGEFDKIMSIWKKVLDDESLSLAYHAREHLCVPLWMELLNNKDETASFAFEHEYYSFPLRSAEYPLKSLRPSLYYRTEYELHYLLKSLDEGLKELSEGFNKDIFIFCPPNGLSSDVIDSHLSNLSIKGIATKIIRTESKDGNLKKRYKGFGKRKQKYRSYFRNCGFEPLLGRGIEKCLRDISYAFQFNNAAIISTHRVNYSSRINKNNSGFGAQKLAKLLQRVVNLWPDTVFMSSEEYVRYLDTETLV